MGRKPSERRHFRDEDMELNLVPMMNLIAILIPALLISMAFIEIAVINVSAPLLGTNAQTKVTEKKKERSLDLSVTITEEGYVVSANSKALEKAQGKALRGAIALPLIEQEVSCMHYLGTKPPPRKVNKRFEECKHSEENHHFKIYDKVKLQKILVNLKSSFPEETRIKIAASKTIEFEAITELMDVTREIANPEGKHQELFPEVILNPNLS